ncbi:MAG: Ig-like domain-containing protein [Candidatus Saccharibacteria bacterium]
MKKIIIIILLVIIVAFITGFIYFTVNNNRDQSFSLIKTKPNNYSKEVNVNSEITFEFSEPLSKNESKNTVEVIPNSFLIKTINDKVLTLKPNITLKENTQYTIKISNIESINNEKLSPITLIFTTGTDNSDRTRFIKSLPIQAEGFYIEYDDLTNIFIVTIQKNPYDKYKQNAIDYLNSKGINTNTEQIQYKELRFLQGNGAPPG